eukprot:1898091-Amphidinium_carterae.1
MPYSLRRGGATAHFVRHRSYDRVCHIGRWAQVATCRIYVNQARKFLLQQAFSLAASRLIHSYNTRLLHRLRLVAAPGRDAWKRTQSPSGSGNKKT